MPLERRDLEAFVDTSCDGSSILCHTQDKQLGPGYRMPRASPALLAHGHTSDSARVPKMLTFSSRLMPPINTRCKLGEFAPSVNQTLPRCYLTPTKLIKSDLDPVRIPPFRLCALILLDFL